MRRIPIVEGGNPIGIVSLGDLACSRDPKSALGQISAAPATAWRSRDRRAFRTASR